LTGDDESKFREGITEYDIRIMLDQFDRSKTDNVSKLTFINNKGQPIELQQFADVAISTGPTKLERQDRIRAINIYSQVLGSTSGVVSQIIDAKMKSIKLPPGVSYQYTGQQKYMMESFISLFVALGAGILFVYMIMVALYDSFVYPFVVLFSIPVAIIGALYGLALTNKSMSIYSMLGIIMLVGLVAKNAILLVDRTNQMKKEQGLSTFDALIEAAQTRLRPILMTTFAMVMGMSPIALSTSAGSEAKSGLAVVLIGGLLSSMFLTLLLVPVVYQSMDKLRIWIPKVFKRLLGIKEKAEELSVNTES
jgi:HAE1 family hydrophobic/amphiphilic exporter-1